MNYASVLTLLTNKKNRERKLHSLFPPIYSMLIGFLLPISYNHLNTHIIVIKSYL
jgi:hypothetical protein